MWWYAIYLPPLDFLCVGGTAYPTVVVDDDIVFLCAFHSGSPPILYKKNTMIMMNMVSYMSTKSIAVYKIIDTFFLSKIEKETNIDRNSSTAIWTPSTTVLNILHNREIFLTMV